MEWTDIRLTVAKADSARGCKVFAGEATKRKDFSAVKKDKLGFCAKNPKTFYA